MPNTVQLFLVAVESTLALRNPDKCLIPACEELSAVRFSFDLAVVLLNISYLDDNLINILFLHSESFQLLSSRLNIPNLDDILTNIGFLHAESFQLFSSLLI